MQKIILLLSCLLLVACNNRRGETSMLMGNHAPDDALLYEEEIEMEPPQTASPPSSPVRSLEVGSKIIKNGTLAFTVTGLETAKSTVDSMVLATKAYYENEQYHSYGNTNTYELRVRVPNKKFDTLVRQLEAGVGSLTTKNISARDVTEEYTDLNIRLENNLAYLGQYQTLLLKATSIKEILEVKEKIRRIEEEIEAKKGRIKFLDDRVNYSTVSIEISEKVSRQFSNKPSLGSRIATAFTNGAQGFISFVVGLISLWPFLLMLSLLLLARKRIWRALRGSRRKEKRASGSENPANE